MSIRSLPRQDRRLTEIAGEDHCSTVRFQETDEVGRGSVGLLDGFGPGGRRSKLPHDFQPDAAYRLLDAAHVVTVSFAFALSGFRKSLAGLCTVSST
jgi:hypothetical protein